VTGFLSEIFSFLTGLLTLRCTGRWAATRRVAECYSIACGPTPVSLSSRKWGHTFVLRSFRIIFAQVAVPD
jgi:hypothetical protein